jgi:hypothetical protein
MKITIDIDEVKLWEAVWGSDGSGVTYWCSHIRQPDGSDIDLWVNDENGQLVGNPQDMKLRDAEDGTWHTVTLAQLVEAYGKALSNGETHCGVSLSLDDSDECFGDIVLQYAVFGEMIYG